MNHQTRYTCIYGSSTLPELQTIAVVIRVFIETIYSIHRIPYCLYLYNCYMCRALTRNDIHGTNVADDIFKCVFMIDYFFWFRFHWNSFSTGNKSAWFQDIQWSFHSVHFLGSYRIEVLCNTLYYRGRVLYRIFKRLNNWEGSYGQTGFCEIWIWYAFLRDILLFKSTLGPISLTWINFNPGKNK